MSSLGATSFVLLSGQMALLNSADIIANNIANSSTTGFKREGIRFESYLSKSSGGAQGVSYVQDRGTYRDTTPGTISSTGNPLDLAIQGQGYFQVQTPQGTQYTRDGAFQLDNQGQLVTSTGQPVLGADGQPLTFPIEAADITISGDGFITAQIGTSSTRAQLGKIGVVKFTDDQALTPAGANMLATTQTPTPVTGHAIVQGAVENSNVSPIKEMTNLINIQRAYEQATNLVGQGNASLSDAIDKLSQTS